MPVWEKLPLSRQNISGWGFDCLAMCSPNVSRSDLKKKTPPDWTGEAKPCSPAAASKPVRQEVKGLRKEEKKTGGGIEISESCWDRGIEKKVEALLTRTATDIIQSQLMAADRNKFYSDEKTAWLVSPSHPISHLFVQLVVWLAQPGWPRVPPTPIDQSAESKSCSILLHGGKLIVPAWGDSKVLPGQVRFFFFNYLFSYLRKIA